MSLSREQLNKILTEGDLTFCQYKLIKCDHCQNENNPVFITNDTNFICINCAKLVIDGNLHPFPGFNIDVNFDEVLTKMKKHGLFYYPASKHYPESSSNVRVVCDNCGVSPIPASFGYERFDLCLTCFSKICV